MDSIAITRILDMFPNDEAARGWFEQNIWPDGPVCPHCSSVRCGRTIQSKMPYRCRSCHKRFSVRIGTVMEGTHISYREWAIAIYLFQTHPKGVSSVQLSKDLGITQRSAWFMAHRIRECWKGMGRKAKFMGPVEVDECFVGSLERNRHVRRKHRIPKTPVVGMRDRDTGMVRAKPIPETTKARLCKFIEDNAIPIATHYTDENRRIPDGRWV